MTEDENRDELDTARGPSSFTDSPKGESLLERLALHRPELRAWALYDWANSALVTVVITAVYPIYFESVACQGADKGVAASRHAYVTAASLLAIALLAPVLGAYADRARAKKRSLAIFMFAGAAATAGLFFAGQGDWKLAALLFFFANVGASGSFVFYDALLPHVASKGPRETDRLSTSGFALGYLSGGLVLGLCLVLVDKPEMIGLAHWDKVLRTRTTFVLVALWWVAFSIPLFLRVAEPPGAVAAEGAALEARGVKRLIQTGKELFGYRNAFWMLIAFLFYNDAINTIIRMATLVGSELELDTSAMMLAILLVQFVGIPFTFLFGAFAGRFGAKRMVLFGLAVYLAVTLLAANLRTETHFYALAVLVGMVQGGTQALSRSLFAGMIPKDRSAEFFGVFAVMDRFGAIIGPLLFGIASARLGASRSAPLVLLPLFFIGAFLLLRVDVAAGRHAALEDPTSPD